MTLNSIIVFHMRYWWAWIYISNLSNIIYTITNISNVLWVSFPILLSPSNSESNKIFILWVIFNLLKKYTFPKAVILCPTLRYSFIYQNNLVVDLNLSWLQNLENIFYFCGSSLSFIEGSGCSRLVGVTCNSNIPWFSLVFNQRIFYLMKENPR